MDIEEDPKRGTSRANSVRFDESSMHGNYSHANRSASELVPARTGSGLGGAHPLTERSFSHRSDGRQSWSAQSQRTFSLGQENSRSESSATAGAAAQSAVTPPPGLFILGPVPSIIRCWLTTTFSNDSLLYAAICTGAYSSAISSRVVQKLGLGDEIVEEDGAQTIKLPFYLPEASVYQSSSRSASPAPQVPALTVRFLVREIDVCDDKTIQIFLGSDVLRAHNADILFSQDKILIVDDERNRISVPLVRPEDHTAFKALATGPQQGASLPYRERDSTKDTNQTTSSEERTTETPPRRASPTPRRFPKSTLTVRTSNDSFEGHNKTRSAHFPGDSNDNNASEQAQPKSAQTSERSSSKGDGAATWGSWRRDSNQSTSTSTTTNKTDASPYLAAASQSSGRPRNMKILKPSRQPSGSMTAPQSAVEPSSSSSRMGEFSTNRNVQPTGHDDGTTNNAESSRSSADGGARTTKPRSANPVGGASAFGWLNSRAGNGTSE